MKIAKGTRWEDRDWRESGRVVEVYDIAGNRALTRVVVAPRKPWTVDRRSQLSLKTLRRRYRPVASTEGT